MLKIAIIGPESTGKTVLAKDLSSHFNTVWEPELAREYVEALNRDYTYDDVCEIGRTQIIIEKKYQQNNIPHEIVFFDTDLIITKVWLEYKYGECPEFLSKRLSERFIDFYLLCKPDLDWQPDPVREHGSGDERDFFYQWYKREIETLHIPYAEIGGQDKERIKNALEAIYNAFGSVKQRKK